MKTQIHKATADALGISQSKDGFYYHPNGGAVPLNKHNEIIAQIQSETKAWCLTDIEKLRQENDHLKQLLQEITENAVFNAGTDYRIDEKFIEKAKSFLNTKH